MKIAFFLGLRVYAMTDIIEDNPFEADESGDALAVVSTNVTVPVNMTSNYDYGTCSTGMVMAGVKNPGGTKNMKDIEELSCRQYQLRRGGIPVGAFTTTDTQSIPILFGGTGKSATTRCPDGTWATGFRRGSNDNPNNATLQCAKLELPDAGGYPSYLIPTADLDVAPTQLGDKDTWGRCENASGIQRGSTVNIFTEDKGSNIYDMKTLQCAPHATIEGPFPEFYNYLAGMTPNQRLAACCISDDAPADQKSLLNSACSTFGLRDHNMGGECVNLEEHCAAKVGGVQRIHTDAACQKWCSTYPESCEAIREALTEPIPDDGDSIWDNFPSPGDGIKDESFWDQYKLWIILGISAILVVIAAVVVIRRRSSFTSGTGDGVMAASHMIPVAEAVAEVLAL